MDSLAVGEHLITLVATDSEGLADSAFATVTINARFNHFPVASIDAPSNGASFVAGDTVQFIGRAIDPEDGVLSGDALTWTSDVDGLIGTGTSQSNSRLTVGDHLITLVATDQMAVLTARACCCDQLQGGYIAGRPSSSSPSMTQI
jgi:hypothetical protein